MSYAIIEQLRGRKRQCGQALNLSLAAIVFLSLMTYAAFNISQMIHAKNQTMNAADAGAYTAATIVARDLNFMAYSNRAMVANHAVMGQIVSLASLSEMIYLASRDVSRLRYLRGVPFVGWALAVLGDAFKGVAGAIGNAVLPTLEVLAKLQNGLITAISAMQPLAHRMTMIDMLKIENVIKANDPELEWATTSNAGGMLTVASNAVNIKDAFFGNFTDQRSDDTALGRMREVVNLSRDGFTIKREWLRAPWPVEQDTFFHGGTQLSSDNKTWMGVDGFEFDIDLLFFSLGIRLWETGEIAGSDGISDWRKLSHGDLYWNAHGAAYKRRNKRLKDSYSGIQPYQELKEIKPGDRSNDSPIFVVLVYKPVRSNNESNITRTPNATQTFGTADADNPFHLKEGRAKIYGVAASQVYFRRPTENENDPTAGKKSTNKNDKNAFFIFNEWYPDGTYASLFSPYWQARLTDVPTKIKAALLATVND